MFVYMIIHSIDPNGYCLDMYIQETDVRLMAGNKK